MKIASHLLSVGLVLASVTCAAAATKPGYVLATVNLRAAPSRGAEILTKIPGGSLIEFGGCTEGWCEVTWKEKTGYAIQTALDLSGRVPATSPAQSPSYRTAAQPPGYRPRGFVVDEPIYYDPPPVVYYDGPFWPRRFWRRGWW